MLKKLCSELENDNSGESEGNGEIARHLLRRILITIWNVEKCSDLSPS